MSIEIRELDWAPGRYQWDCPDCGSCGNVTPAMVTVPSAAWHPCSGNALEGR